jgi:hypothetical protein
MGNINHFAGNEEPFGEPQAVSLLNYWLVQDF